MNPPFDGLGGPGTRAAVSPLIALCDVRLLEGKTDTNGCEGL